MKLTYIELCRLVRACGQISAAEARAIIGAVLDQTPRAAGASIECGARRTRDLAHEHALRRLPHIEAMREAIVRHLGYACSETLRNLEAHFREGARRDRALVSAEGGPRGVAADIIFDRAQFADGLLATLRDESAEALHEAGNDLFAEIQRDDAFSMPDPVARQFLAERENLLRDIPDEMHAAIEAELQAGLDAGESLRQLSRRVTNKFAAITAERAETIASTETNVAYSFSRQEAMKAAGIQFKTWLTSHLPNVRATHEAAEDDPRNARVPVGEPFFVGKVRLLAPGLPFTPDDDDPSEIINCGCIALALADDKEVE